MNRVKKILIQPYCLWTLITSPLFNSKWYRTKYNDINIVYKIFPILHYYLHGWKELRNPSPNFNTKYYLDRYNDVKLANINPLFHYERIGRKENREYNNTKHIYNQINNSTFFQQDWYNRYYLYNHANIAPVLDYTKHIQNRNPSQFFYTNEYLLLNPDVAMHNIKPFFHYLWNGQYENRIFALTELKEYSAPEGSIDVKKEFTKREKFTNKIVTVLATFSGNAKLEDFQLYLLKGLVKISDYIIVVGDNPIYETELKKIKNLCNTTIFKRHEEYDFGSYKVGYKYLIENNILNNDDDLLFINDANYGPVFPFENIIKHYREQQCDFYGLSIGVNELNKSIQSFFYIFKSNVYLSICFINFINNIKKEISPAWVVYNYEFTLTNILLNNNFRYSLYIPENFIDNKSVIPTKYGYTLLSQYKYPLVKRKAIQGSTIEPINDILSYIKENNSELYEIIMKQDNPSGYKQNKIIPLPSKYTILHNYSEKEKEIQLKVKNGGKINAVFLVYSIETFSSENIMNQLLNDDNYNVELYIIPDIRKGDHEGALNYIKTLDILKQKYPFIKETVDIAEKEVIKTTVVNNKEIEENVVEKYFFNWKNIIKGKDIVFYHSIYDLSFSLYNPYYAVRENILSVFIPHEIYPYKYDRNFYKMDNFNNFWKVFLDSQESYEEYKNYGQCNGINAEVVGFWPKYNNIKQNTTQKNTILIAPYFSFNNNAKMLNLYAIETFGDNLLDLPNKYPNIDFIFLFSSPLYEKIKDNEQIIENYKLKIDKLNNATYYEHNIDLDIIKNSSAIITDSGILFIDAAMLNIPCLYLLEDEQKELTKFNDLGAYFFQHTNLCNSINTLGIFINQVVVNDELLTNNLEIINKKLEQNNHTNIINYFKNIFLTK